MMRHGDRPCVAVLVPIPEHMPEALAAFEHARVRPGDPEFGRDDQGRPCFRVDACIEPALRAVWAAGCKTLGCCCGHGQGAGGIITIDTGSYSATPRTRTQERFAEIHDAEDSDDVTLARDLEPLARHLSTLAPREYLRMLEAIYGAAQIPMPWEGNRKCDRDRRP